MEWYELRKLASASSLSDVSNVVYSNQGKWHYALEYYYNYEKKYFGYMHYINAFMMDKMVDKLMCSIALKNSLNYLNIFKLHSMALFFIY